MKSVQEIDLKAIGGGFGAYPGMETDINRGYCFVTGFVKGLWDRISS